MNPPQPPLGATPEPSATNRLLEPDHREMLGRLRKLAASAVLGQNVSIDEAELRQLLAFETELATTRAALTQCEERVKCARRLRAESISSAEWTAQLDLQAKTEAALALCEKSRRDEESWWKEKHDYQARAESAETVIKQITEGHPNAGLVCELRTRATAAEAKLAQCENRLAEMTARATSLSLHLPPETLCGDVQKWRDEALALTAAHAKALEDGKRMDWLESVRFITSRRKHPTDGKTWLLLDGNMTAGASIREAIDAAMKASAPATIGKEHTL